MEYAGRRIESIRTAFGNACRKAGITYKVCPYSLRHLYCTYILNGGGNIGNLSKNMGHTTPRMATKQYNHISTEGQRQIANMMPDLTRNAETEPSKVISTESVVLTKTLTNKRVSENLANPLI